jgi:hypothetical protein
VVGKSGAALRIEVMGMGYFGIIPRPIISPNTRRATVRARMIRSTAASAQTLQNFGFAPFAALNSW